MLKNDFEDYLQEIFINENPHIYKDELPDAFNDYEWGIEELIEHGNKFGAKLAEQIIDEAQKLHKSGSHSNSIDIDSYLKTQFLK